jgi:type VI secretion system secreted protein Hcp
MAENDIFLDLKGIQGESQDSTHKKSIHLESFGWSCLSPRDVSTQQPIGKRQHRPLSCVKHTDAATALLLQALFSNRKIDSGKIYVRKAGEVQRDYLIIELTTVFVTNFSISSPIASLPIENFDLVYEKINVTYREQTALGTLGGPVTAEDVLPSAVS